MLNLLVAYPYLQSILKAQGFGEPTEVYKSQSTRLLLDSGAFTAWKSGKPIQLDDYCRFVENLPFMPWRYFTLDVIGDPHNTLKNYEIMLNRGFNPIPIFTRGEDPSVLETYYNSSDVVGVGGLVGTRGNKGYVKGIMKKINERKVHWLGFTNLDYIKHYKPYMCDSSSWETAGRYGRMSLYMGNGQCRPILKHEFKTKPDALVIDRIKQLGLDPFKMQNESEWHGGPTSGRTLGARSGVALSVDIEKKTGTKMFLAHTTAQAQSLLWQAYSLLTTGSIHAN